MRQRVVRHQRPLRRIVGLCPRCVVVPIVVVATTASVVSSAMATSTILVVTTIVAVAIVGCVVAVTGTGDVVKWFVGSGRVEDCWIG